MEKISDLPEKKLYSNENLRRGLKFYEGYKDALVDCEELCHIITELLAAREELAKKDAELSALREELAKKDAELSALREVIDLCLNVTTESPALAYVEVRKILKRTLPLPPVEDGVDEHKF